MKRLLVAVMLCFCTPVYAANFSGWGDLSLDWAKSGMFIPETRAYISRVQADGGTILDPIQVNKDFIHAKNNGYINNIGGWWTAYGGIKKDVSTGAVSKLYSYGGASQDLLQASGSNQPIWSANGQNGRPIITFNGSAHYLRTGAYTLNQPYDNYTVFKQITWVNGRYVYDGQTFATARLLQNSSTPILSFAAGTLVTAAATQVPVNTWHLTEALFNGASSKFFVDTVNTSGTVNVGAANAGGFTLGNAGSGSLFGNIAWTETLILTVSNGPSSAISSYLKSIWGTP